LLKNSQTDTPIKPEQPGEDLLWQLNQKSKDGFAIRLPASLRLSCFLDERERELLGFAGRVIAGRNRNGTETGRVAAAKLLACALKAPRLQRALSRQN